MHQNLAFDLVSVTIRTMSSRSSPHQPGADFSNEAAVDRRPSAALDLEALAMQLVSVEAGFAAELFFRVCSHPADCSPKFSTFTLLYRDGE
jgi:hypothetical protein